MDFVSIPPISRQFIDTGYSFGYSRTEYKQIFVRHGFLNSAHFSASEHVIKPFGLNHLIKPTAGSRANRSTVLMRGSETENSFEARCYDDGVNEHNHVTSYSSDVMLSINDRGMKEN